MTKVIYNVILLSNMTNVRGDKKYRTIKTIAAIALTIAVLSALSFAVVKANETKEASLDYEQSFALSELNRIRQSNNLSSLQWNDKLADVAKLKAEDMLARGYFSHESPDGEMVWGRILDSGYDYLTAGENLAIDFNNLSQAYESWMASPSHKENILSDKYIDFGFASAEGDFQGKKTTIYVQIFASPESIYDQVLSNLGGNNG